MSTAKEKTVIGVVESYDEVFNGNKDKS